MIVTDARCGSCFNREWVRDRLQCVRPGPDEPTSQPSPRQLSVPDTIHVACEEGKSTPVKVMNGSSLALTWDNDVPETMENRTEQEALKDFLVRIARLHLRDIVRDEPGAGDLYRRSDRPGQSRVGSLQG